MPRYYFHTNLPGEGSQQDNEGIWCESVNEAKCQAVSYAGRLLADSGERFWDDADFELLVTNEDRLILFLVNVHGTQAPAALTEPHLV